MSDIRSCTISKTVSIPIADKKPVVSHFHGRTLIDDYSWLEDKNDPAVMDFLVRNNEYTEQVTSHLKSLGSDIFSEIKSRTKETDMSLPVRKGNWWFYLRTHEGKDYTSHHRLKVSDKSQWIPPTITTDVIPGEELLLDVNEIAQGCEFFSLGVLSVSQDGSLLAYSTDTTGDERYDLVIKDLRTGKLYGDSIESIAAGALFSLDGQYLFYQTLDEAWRPDTVWRHKIGTTRSEDVQIFHEPDERFWLGVGYSRSKKFLFIEVGSKTTSEVFFLDANDPTGEFHSLWGRTENVEYLAEHAVIAGKDYFFIIHNKDAENFRLAVSSCESYSDVIPVNDYDPAIRLEGIDAFDNFLVLSYRSNAVSKIAIAQITDQGNVADLHFIEVDPGNELASIGLEANPDSATPQLRIGFTSFIEPYTIESYDIATGARTVLKCQEVLGGYDNSQYRQQRHWVTARDDVKVPVSLVWHKDTQFPAPVLLYGYGSYEHSIDPSFSIARLSLLNRGVIYAIAHIRGGGELGRPWYRQGKLLEKKNTFADFVDCAQSLKFSSIATGIVAYGGSAGGLLVGAAVNEAPELFSGVMAHVPFVDALNTILDPSLPLTITEWEEWGDPLHDPLVFDYMASYSPYNNVSTQDYPEIFAITSLNDTRVRYSEPAKWVAKLREYTTGDKPILLKTELIAGHGGVSGRYKRWEEIGEEYAWILDVLGK